MLKKVNCLRPHDHCNEMHSFWDVLCPVSSCSDAVPVVLLGFQVPMSDAEDEMLFKDQECTAGCDNMSVAARQQRLQDRNRTPITATVVSQEPPPPPPLPNFPIPSLATQRLPRLS